MLCLSTSRRASVFRAVRYESLVAPAAHAMEEPLEASWLFDAVIVAEGLIHDFHDHAEVVFVLARLLGDGFHLFPCCPAQGRKQVNHTFLRFLLQDHLLLVQVDSGSPFLVVSGSVAEDRDP